MLTLDTRLRSSTSSISEAINRPNVTCKINGSMQHPWATKSHRIESINDVSSHDGLLAEDISCAFHYQMS